MHVGRIKIKSWPSGLELILSGSRLDGDDEGPDQELVCKGQGGAGKVSGVPVRRGGRLQPHLQPGRRHPRLGRGDDEARREGEEGGEEGGGGGGGERIQARTLGFPDKLERGRQNFFR